MCFERVPYEIILIVENPFDANRVNKLFWEVDFVLTYTLFLHTVATKKTTYHLQFFFHPPSLTLMIAVIFFIVQYYGFVF